MAPTKTYADRDNSSKSNSSNSGIDVIDLSNDKGGVIDLTFSDSSDDDAKTSNSKRTTGNKRLITPQRGKRSKQRTGNITSSSEEEIIEIGSESENENDSSVVATRLKSEKTRTLSPPGSKPPPEESNIRASTNDINAAICTKSPPQRSTSQYRAAPSLRPRALQYDETAAPSQPIATPAKVKHNTQAPSTPSKSAPARLTNAAGSPTVPPQIPHLPGLPTSPAQADQPPPPQQPSSQADADESTFDEYDDEWLPENFQAVYDDFTKSPPQMPNFNPDTTNFWAKLGNYQWLRFYCAKITQKCLTCEQPMSQGDPIVHYYNYDRNTNITQPNANTWIHVKCACRAWQNIYKNGVPMLAMAKRIGVRLGEQYTVATNYREVTLKSIHFTLHRALLTIRSYPLVTYTYRHDNEPSTNASPRTGSSTSEDRQASQRTQYSPSTGSSTSPKGQASQTTKDGATESPRSPMQGTTTNCNINDEEKVEASDHTQSASTSSHKAPPFVGKRETKNQTLNSTSKTVCNSYTQGNERNNQDPHAQPRQNISNKQEDSGGSSVSATSGVTPSSLPPTKSNDKNDKCERCRAFKVSKQCAGCSNAMFQCTQCCKEEEDLCLTCRDHLAHTKKKSNKQQRQSQMQQVRNAALIRELKMQEQASTLLKPHATLHHSSSHRIKPLSFSYRKKQTPTQYQEISKRPTPLPPRKKQSPRQQPSPHPLHLTTAPTKKAMTMYQAEKTRIKSLRLRRTATRATTALSRKTMRHEADTLRRTGNLATVRPRTERRTVPAMTTPMRKKMTKTTMTMTKMKPKVTNNCSILWNSPSSRCSKVTSPKKVTSGWR